ncbi:hypothetical protein JKF63_06087 [Porcisia hertigi]|uniref:Ecotin n=1 Tax=Porcisia hertigi TaxID=2761500 RepID=A0A836IGI8_9TRYP|nr:hypothetical protein JKF63_06087 [Porcisia hertigi]
MPANARKTLAEYKAPYPEPDSDQRRYVIFLDPMGDEAESRDYKVELIPGRVEDLDGANRYFLGGSIEEKTISGWGYSYFVVKLGVTAGTLMAALGDAAQKRPRFVSMRTEKFCRYNSKLPIVVYMPKDGELRYRIWHAQFSNDGKATSIKAKEM